MKFGLLRAAAVGTAAAVVATAAVSSLTAQRAQAANCPSVDSNTGAVSPAPGPGVNWSGCDLAGADLTFADMSGADLSSANLTNANLLHATLSNANLAATDFASASLIVADLRQANIAGTALSTATLTGIKSSDVAGQPASLPANWLLVAATDASSTTHHYLIGPTANIAGAGLEGVNLAGDNLEQLNISNGSLARTNLSATDLGGANLQGTQSGGITGQPSALPTDWFTLNGYLLGPGANAAGADLAGADLTGHNLQGVNFVQANLSGANMAGLDLDSDSFLQANLTGANLSNASLNADLRQANLTNANLTGATITSANLSGATWLHTTCPDGTDSDQYVAGCLSPLDTAAPVASPVITAGTAGQNGWFTSAVTVAWNWTDDGSIVQTECRRFSTSSAQGKPVTLASSCTDLAGKTAHATYPVNIDTTPPKVAVLGVSANRIYVLGAAPRPQCQTTDVLSGVGHQAIATVSTTGSNSVGAFTATCSGAVDIAGNHQVAPVRVSYTVAYGFGFGSLNTGETIAKSRHNVAQKFRLTDAAGRPIRGAVAAALSRGGKVRASMTGPGISRQSVTCSWNSTVKLFSCRIRIPRGVRTGQRNPYSIAAWEEVTKRFVVIPAVGTAVNPVVIHFR